MDTASAPAGSRAFALAAAGCGLAYAAVSAYWTAGGDALLDTVGGAVERAAREGGATAALLGVTATLVKLAGVALALALARTWPPRITLLLRRTALVAGSVLVAYGGALVAAGSLVLTDVVPAPGADRHALTWHVGVWDLWFLLWGLLLLSATRRSVPGRTTRPDSEEPEGRSAAGRQGHGGPDTRR